MLLNLILSTGYCLGVSVYVLLMAGWVPHEFPVGSWILPTSKTCRQVNSNSVNQCVNVCVCAWCSVMHWHPIHCTMYS